jgi:hypothetical protein
MSIIMNGIVLMARDLLWFLKDEIMPGKFRVV